APIGGERHGITDSKRWRFRGMSGTRGGPGTNAAEEEVMIARVLMGVLALGGLTADAGGVAPRARLAAEHRERMRKGNRLWAEVEKQLRAGRIAEAAGLLRRVLALERAVRGTIHAQPQQTLAALARLLERTGEKEEAVAAIRE